MSFFSKHDQKYLSLVEAAKEFGVSQNYLRFLIFKNKLNAIKFGRNWGGYPCLDGGMAGVCKPRKQV